MTTDIAVRDVHWQENVDYTTAGLGDEWDGGNSSSRLFERSRIKALAGKSRFVRAIIVHHHGLSSTFQRVSKEISLCD